MKKVLLVSSSSAPVGVSTHVLNLARLLFKDGILDVVVCPEEGWLPEQLQKAELPFEILNISYAAKEFVSSNMNFFSFLKKHSSANVVHLHGRFPLFVSILSMLMNKHLKFVVTIHQFSATGSHGAWNWKLKLEGLLLKYISRICCVSVALKEDTLERLGENHRQRIDVIPNWIQPLHFSVSPTSSHRKKLRSNSASKKTIRICAVGRLSHEKGFDILINAMAILHRLSSKISCDIFGDGPCKVELSAIIQNNNLESVVTLKGISNKVRSFLPDYDFIVLPSRQEACCQVVLEAYDAELPIVASNIPGLKETVIHEQTGLLFEVCNTEHLAASITRMASSEEFREQLVCNGQDLLPKYLPNAFFLEEYIRFYESAREKNQSLAP